MSKFFVSLPMTPGATPTRIPADTIQQAREIARERSRNRPDLRGQDVRIELENGKRIEFAGTGR